MARKKFILTTPFREIQTSDATKLFDNELSRANGIDLAFLVEMNRGNQYVFVYEEVGKILAFLTFIDKGSHFHLDLVETNRLYPSTLKPGGKLIILLEMLSIRFNYQKITLNSVQGKISYYERLGYIQTGRTYPNPIYDTLIEMEKNL